MVLEEYYKILTERSEGYPSGLSEQRIKEKRQKRKSSVMAKRQRYQEGLKEVFASDGKMGRKAWKNLRNREPCLMLNFSTLLLTVFA